MGNSIQRLIYNLSVTAPLTLVLAFVWYQQLDTIVIPLALVVLGIVLTVLLYASFGYAVKNTESISFRAVNISSKDGWLIAYVISYLLPFASIGLKNFNILVTGAVAIGLILAVSFINTAIPHPLLFIRGYHFYAVSGANGVANYILLSKKKALRNNKQIKSVKRLFEYLLLEA